MAGLVEVQNLYKSFGNLNVLNDVSFEVKESENLVVFGRSGVGKSVLLKCIIRLIQPDAGEISVLGKDVLNLSKKELNELRKEMGFLFQSAALYDSMTVRENLEFPLIRNYNFSQSEINEKVEKALSSVALLSAIDKMPSELSGGMRKRVGLARTIITEPKIILYDEPTTGLDPITTKEISELILLLQKQYKMTSISVTHDIVCARIIADRAIFLNEGKIVFDGKIEDINNNTDPHIKNFFSVDLINQ